MSINGLKHGGNRVEACNSKPSLRKLLQGVDVVAYGGDLDIRIGGLSYDSRTVQSGDLFFALPGQKTNGTLYICEAYSQGASAVLAGEPVEYSGTWVAVADPLESMATISGNYYGRPADAMKIIGITGSNGKTTCAYLTEAVLKAAGHCPGVLSTVEYRCGSWRQNASATTPLAPDLHRYFKQMKQLGATHISMEVSSHALVTKRVAGLMFDTAAFTNLTQDHLDFHKTIEEYGRAKRLLFEKYLHPDGTAVLNGDDNYVRELIPEFDRSKRLSFGTGVGVDVGAVDVHIDADRTRFQAVTPQGKVDIESRLLGMHNVENLLAAVAIGLSQGISLETIREALFDFRNVPGRLESVECGQDFKVLVDYAHTPDALERVLVLLRQLPHRRILTIFGCGGDRDRGKRPQMGRIACENSDVVYVTSDNPRSEEPMAIIDEIKEGMKGYEGKYRTIVDREEAIVSAINDAGESDIVLLAGKGHETTQTRADRTVTFDDRKVAESALRERCQSS